MARVFERYAAFLTTSHSFDIVGCNAQIPLAESLEAGRP